MTGRIRWDYDYFEEQEELEEEEERRNEDNNKENYFESDVPSSESEKSNDYNELNALKQRYKEKSERDSMLYNENSNGRQDDRDNLYGLSNDSSGMDFATQEKRDQSRNDLYNDSSSMDHSAEPSVSLVSQEEMNKQLYNNSHNDIDDAGPDTTSLSDCLNVESLSKRFLSNKEPTKSISNKSGARVIGWGEFDNDDEHTIFSTNIDTNHASSNRSMFRGVSGTIIDEDDMYEGFVSRETFVKKVNTDKNANSIDAQEEYDSKRPWRKAPSISAINENDSFITKDASATTISSKYNSDKLLLLDDHYDIENQSICVSESGASEIHLAQDCLTLYETMNSDQKTFFEQPHFEEIVHKTNIEESSKQDVDTDIQFLAQLQPASTTGFNTKETGFYVTGALAHTKLGAKLLKTNDDNSDTNSIGSMVRDVNTNVASVGAGGWGKLRRFLQTDDSKAVAPKPKMTIERKKSILQSIVTYAKKMEEDALQQNENDTIPYPEKQEDDSSTVEDKKEDTDDLSSNLESNSILQPEESIQKIDIHDDDKNPYQDEIIQPKKKNSITVLKERFMEHKFMISLFFTIILIGGIIGIVIIFTSGDDSTEEEKPKPDTPIVKWNTVFGVMNATGASSLSDDGKLVVYNLKNNTLIFTDVDTKQSRISEWTTYPTTQIEIPGTEECMVKALLNDPRGVINVKLYSDGVWKSFYDGLTNLTIESVSISAGCKRFVLGVPTYNQTGVDAGMARVYDVTQDTLTPLGGDMLGQAGYKTGDAVAISNTGTVLAVASSHADINGKDSGQVTIYELQNNKWKNVHTISGNPGDLLGSSVFVSHDGTRVAIGSAGYTFESNENCGKCEVFHRTNTTWEKLGNTITGRYHQSQMGKVITLSGNGNRLFTNDNRLKATVLIWEWEPFQSKSKTMTTWANAGSIETVGIFNEAIDLTASFVGDRVAIGYDGAVSVYQNDYDI